MKRHRKSVTIAGYLLLTILLLSASAAADIIRLGDQVVPTAQSISLVLDADQPDYSGTTTIVLKVNEATNSFRLHSRTNTIHELTLTGPSGEIPAKFAFGDDDGLIITADQELPIGEYSMSIAFTSPFNTQADALYRLDVDGHGYAFTQFESDAAREAFPCFDTPKFKIPFDLTLTIPESHIAISNTPVADSSTKDGWTTVHFETTRPLPSYLIAIATGPLETVEIPGMSVPGRVVTVKGKSNLTALAVEMAPKILSALENYFDSPYPFKKLDLIAVPEFWAGAMENAGAITFRETVLLADPSNTTLRQKRSLAGVMAHEMAHMWFGDLVTMAWWDDLWLNESFAEWMSHKITAQLYPQYDTHVAAVREGTRAMDGDARPSAMAIRQPVLNTDYLLQNVGAIYAKGMAVLNMFEHFMGKETFRQGIQRYLNAHRWGSATSDDLWAALDSVSGTPVHKAFETFVDQPGVPMVSLHTSGDGEIQLSQDRFANYGVTQEAHTPWQIPITLKYFDGHTIREHSLLLTDSVQSVRLESDGAIRWIFPNAGALGYYRWIVPSHMLLAMADDSRDKLSVPERISYLMNLGGLLDAGAVSGADYLRTLARFADDTDPDVTRTILSCLSSVHSAFVQDNLANEFAVYVRSVLAPSVQKYGFTPSDSEDDAVTLLRPSLMEWMGEYGRDSAVISLAKEKTAEYLRDPDSVDPSLASSYLSLAALDGDSALWEEFRTRFEHAELPQDRSRYLYLLGGFRDTVIAKRALQYTLDGPIRPQELMDIPRVVGEVLENQSLVFNWVIDHYDTIIARTPQPYHAYLPYIASGCSMQRLEIARKFFSKPEFHQQGMETSLSRVSDQVTDCVALRDRTGESVRDYLSHFTAD